jgi:transcriptional regulator with XRE-family HTH domain
MSAAAVDGHVAARVRECRVILGLTQQQLGDLIGVNNGQVHKYERGLNRLPVGTLYEIALVFNTPITWFYDGLGRKYRGTPRQRMLTETMRHFSEIKNEKHQEAFSQLVRALAGH